MDLINFVIIPLLASYAVIFVLHNSPATAFLEWRSEEPNPAWYWHLLPGRLCDVLLCLKCSGMWWPLFFMTVNLTSDVGHFVTSWLATAGLFYLISFTTSLRQNYGPVQRESGLFGEHFPDAGKPPADV